MKTSRITALKWRKKCTDQKLAFDDYSKTVEKKKETNFISTFLKRINVVCVWIYIYIYTH